MAAYSAPVLNGVTLPHISGYLSFVAFRGSQTELANGALRVDLVDPDAKRVWYLEWVKLDDAGKAKVEAAFAAVTQNQVAFLPPDGGGPYTVTVDQGFERVQLEAFMAAGKIYYRARLQLREV